MRCARLDGDYGSEHGGLAVIRIIDGHWQTSLDNGRTWLPLTFGSFRAGDDAIHVPGMEKRMADYGTPSMLGREFEDAVLSPLDKLLDEAGVGPEGTVAMRLRKLVNAYVNIMGDGRQYEIPEDVLTRQQEVESAVEEITAWWRGESEKMIARTAPKAVEYGAHDLEIMGVGLASLVHTQLSQATPEERSRYGQYAAVAFYLMGKVARMMSALEQGMLPKDDTEFDIAVYAFMAMRIRQTGRWV